MLKRRLIPVAAIAVIGAAGLTMLQSHEGLRTSTYMDPVGIPTICYGHTGPEVRMGMKLTVDQCNQVLLYDIRKHQVPIMQGHPQNCIRNAPLTPNQRDAVTIFTFNVGNTAFCSSTMAKRLAARDYIGASDQFARWNKGRVNGRMIVLRGLTRRRADERALFLSLSRPEPQGTLSGRAAAILI
jgi:lysozyme